MKKIIALILVIVFIPSLLIACGSKQLNIKEANYIVLKDEEDNSSIEITDPKTVEKIIKDINSLSLKKGESIQVPVDWKYQLICYDNDNKIIGVMGIVDAKTIGYDDHYYSIIDGNIDIINGNIDIKIQSSLEGENIIQFVENRGDEYTYDFKLDDMKSIEISTYGLINGKWKPVFSKNSKVNFTDNKGRLTLDFKNLGEGLKLALQSENHDSSTQYSTEITESFEGMGSATSVLNKTAKITYEEEIPLAIQILTTKNSLIAYDVQYFFTPEEYEIHNYEHVYAITIKFSED